MKQRGKGISLPGKLWGWGYNFAGVMGDGTTTSRRTPINIPGRTFCVIGGGFYTSLRIDHNGFGWSCGYNSRGELGDNSVVSKNTPVSIWGNHTFCRIVATAGTVGLVAHCGALDKNGKAWMWAYNFYGQLGNNDTTSYCTPVSVWGAHTFCEISAGEGGFTLAINNSGKIWGWGNNQGGYLGNNSLTSQKTPVSIYNTTRTFCKISSGTEHTLALDKNGSLWGWGGITYGNLGNNQSGAGFVITPVSVWGSHTFCQISVGTYHSLATDNHGQLWSWGWNQYGQLGNGTVVCQLTPISITNKTFCFVNANGETSFAMDHKYDMWSWGYNLRGQLGINSVVCKCTPVTVYYNSMKPRYPDYL